MPPTAKRKLNQRDIGAPERIRTSDPQIRSLVLYPAELRALSSRQPRVRVKPIEVMGSGGIAIGSLPRWQDACSPTGALGDARRNLNSSSIQAAYRRRRTVLPSLAFG